MTETSEVETIARIIARRLGHNDEAGMYWDRYILPARAIVEYYEQKATGGECGGESEWHPEKGKVYQAFGE